MALLPPFMLDCVAAIGFPHDGGTAYAGTGFFYGKRTGTSPDTGTGTYQVFLVTNRHVLEGQTVAQVRLNPLASTPAEIFEVPLVSQQGVQLWLSHHDPAIDVAVILMNVQAIAARGLQFQMMLDDQHMLPLARAQAAGMTEGDGVFILGFPMGNVGVERNYVVVRQGAIARVRDAMAGKSQEILVDALIFPGNSGGPVITRPEMLAVTGTTAMTNAWLIGIVARYLPYRDVAVSQQTKQARIIFEENSGLAAVIPIDYVMTFIDTIYAGLVALQAAANAAPVPTQPSTA